MARRRAVRLGDGAVVHVVFTDTSDGDLRVDGAAEPLERRRGAVAPTPWTWLRQVHGDRVVVVPAPGACAGEEADAAVTTVPGAVLAVHTADCAGVLMWGTGAGGAVVGAAHAGWRGLGSGILEATVAAMRSAGADEIGWRLGPCISAAHYEFGTEDLDRLAGRYGPALRGVTRDGAAALDLRAGVRAALATTGVTEAPDGPDECTATSEGRYYSWRARREQGRQAAVIWLEASRGTGG
jgi:polyphenol oxidase